MKKSILRLFSLLLVVSLAVASPLAVFATETRASNYFVTSATNIIRVVGPIFTIDYSVTSNGTMDKLGISEIRVQKSSDNASWTTVTTYTPNTHPELMKENVATIGGELRYTGVTGYYYRVIIIYYAQKGIGSGSVTGYSNSLLL